MSGTQVRVMGDALPAVALTARVLVAQQAIIVPITTGVALATLLTGAVIPANAAAMEIQADGGSIRVGLKAAQIATPTSGMRVDDGVCRLIDTPLADVTLVAGAAVAVNAQVAFFDRV